MTDFTHSNLSKIRPKLRTTGNVTGNFGKPKVKAGANKGLGFTNKEVISIVKQDDYLNRMYEAFNKTDDPKMRKFCYEQVRQILVQRGLWGKDK